MGNQYSLVQGVNDLQTWCEHNGEYGQRLINEWQGLSEKGEIKKMCEVSKGTHTKFLWKCENGHTWYADPHNRTNKETQCKYCSASNITVDGVNDLYTWCKNNGEYGELLLKELDEHYNPHNLAKKSADKVIWHCNKGHIWKSRVADRTQRISYCPDCVGHSTSYPEQFIYWSLKQIYPHAENRYKTLKSSENPQGIEFDIAIPNQFGEYRAICIEYSPTGWHKGKENKDNFKKELCKKCNVKFIEIVEDSYNELDEIWGNDIIQFHLIKSQKEYFYTKVLNHILCILGHSISEVDIELAKRNALEYSKGKIEYEKSIEHLLPELALEWNDTSVSPSEVTTGSNRYIDWKCVNCGHEWNAMAYNRAKKHGGCPNCGYSWYISRIGGEQHIKNMEA